MPVVAEETRAPNDLAVALGTGTPVGRFTLVRCVGRGGAGLVYEAFDPELARPVAIKLLRGGDGLARMQARFRREARAMASIKSPHVMPIYDVGVHTFAEISSSPTCVYVVMELVDGGTLREWLRTHRRRRAEIERVLRAAGEGLAAAHRAGLVHRDFKPDNVLVGRDGRVRVTDFGLVRRVGPGPTSTLPTTDSSQETRDADAERDAPPSRSAPNDLGEGALTAQGAVLGTPGYMAPEQVTTGDITPATDVFAFGVTYVEALSGEAPRKRLAGDAFGAQPLFSSKAWDKVPSRLRSILLRCLARDPADRFVDLGAVLRALDAGARRRTRLAMAAATLALTIGAAGAGLTLARREPPALCQGSADLVAEAWAPEVRARIETSFAALGEPLAMEAARGVITRADAYAKNWIQVREQECQATRARHEYGEEVLAATFHCLEQRLATFGQTVRTVAETDARRGLRALAAIGELEEPDRCRATARLAAPASPPLTLTDDESNAVQHARTLHALGRFDDAAREADALVLAGRARGRLSLLANAHSLLSRIHFARYAFPVAEEHALHAMDAAEEAGDDGLRFSAQISLTGALASRGRVDEAVRVLDRAKPLVARLQTPLSQVSWFRYRSQVARLKGWNQEAFDMATLAVSKAEATGLARELPSAHVALTLALDALGRSDEALGESMRALAVSKDVLGPFHPDVSLRLANIVAVLVSKGRYDEALEHARERERLTRLSAGKRDPVYAIAEAQLGDVERRVGKLEAARAHLDEASELAEGADAAVLFEIRLARAQAMADAGLTRLAYAELPRLESLFASMPESDPEVALEYHVFWASLARRVGKPGEGQRVALLARKDMSNLAPDHPLVRTARATLDGTTDPK